ncbi:MAG TPA: T9SS type A sorting domain-containing protein [Bacteroidia bacterium]|nr:T9SS type A sorting domain-containing protein [Bacteroidia bacterium]
MKTTCILLTLCILFSAHRVNGQTLTVNCIAYENACGFTGPPNGLVIASVTPGSSPYTYQWSTGTVHVTNFENDTLFGVPGGNYTVTVTDATAVTGTSSTTVWDNGNTLDYGFGLVSDAITPPCPGTSTGRMILATYANCTPGPFTFFLQNTTSGQTWGPHTVGCNLPTQMCTAMDTFTNLPAGNYVSVLTNAQGCTGSLSVTLPEATAPASNLSVTSSPACGSNPVGKVIAHFNWPNGVPPEFSYTNSFNNGGSVFIYFSYNFQLALYTSTGTFISSQSYTDTIFSNVAPGNYEVRAQFSSPGGTQCYVVRPVSVAAGTLPSATITPAGSLTFCQGGSVLLNVPSGANKTYQWKKGGADISGATLSTYTAAIGGTYKVTVTNTVTGCSKTTSPGTVVTVNPAPSATITPQGPTTFCAGGSVLLKGNSGTGLTYQWKKGGINIAGATAKNYTATIAGVYKIRVTNSYGCNKLSAGVTVTVPCREGAEELISSPGLNVSVFPNPANSEINILFSSDDNFEIEIVNILGERIIKVKNQNRIDISNLTGGIYFIKVFSRNTLVTEKFMKQ